MIVGIGHNYGVGKDTAALALCRELGYRKVAFADPLREVALRTDPIVTSSTRTVNLDAGRGRYAWTVQGLGYEEAKRTHPEVRRFLQALGMACRDVFGEDFWVQQAMRRAARVENGRAVMPDVRYLNEADAVIEAGGILIKITRPGHHGDGHASEVELKDFDGWHYVIENTGTIAELERQVLEIVRKELADRER